MNFKKQKPAYTEIVPESLQDIAAKKRGKRIAKLAFVAGLGAGVAGGTAVVTVSNVNTKANHAQARADQAETAASTAQQDAITALMQAGETQAQLNAKIIEDAQKSEYMAGVAGLTTEQLSEHMSYPPVPEVKGVISPAVAEKQDAATLYLFKSFLGSGNDPTMPLGFACTVFKTGAQTLNSAAHCFAEVNEHYDSLAPGTEMKGGGNVVPSSFITSQELFISNKSSITLGEAQASAVRVTGFNKNYTDTDAAILHVEQPADGSSWFNDITPLNQRATVPSKGTVMRVSGYPSGNPEPVSGEGIVLGQLPASVVGHTYSSPLTVIGIYPDPKLPISMYDCSYGGSGETMVDEQGNWFGDLAFIVRSNNPADSINATPSGTRLIEMESALQTKLAGENYILCGFAPAAPIEPLPLIVDPSYVPLGGK